MRVLMVSLDRGFFGGGSSGDTLQRHRAYADLAGALDVIVFAPDEYERKDWSHNFRVFPTRSKKHRHYRNAVAIARSLGLEKKYDLLVTQDFASPAGVLIKQDLKIPLIVSIHSMFFSSQWLGTNPLNWYLYYRIKKALIRADAFRVTNKTIADKLQSWGIKKPVLIQPTPVDTSKFQIPNHKSQTSSKSQSPNTKIKILYVGRLAPEKNVAMLISAFKALPKDLVLQIVGEGAQEGGLKQLAKEDGRIRFLGPKNFEELISIYQRADIFILPSNTESFGKVLIEAGAAGCALVATATSGAKSIIEDGETGLLVDVGAQDQLKTALEKLTQSEDLRARLAQAAQSMSLNYDAKIATANLVAFWRQIANELE